MEKNNLNKSSRIGIEKSKFFKGFEWDENLKRLLINILNADSKQVENFREVIEDMNPWKKNFEDEGIATDTNTNKKYYKALAQSDYKDLVDLLDDTPTLDDYEQAFDGNLVNPTVLIVGINPKYVEHSGYELEDIYKNPFNECRVPLTKEIGNEKKTLKVKLDNGEIKEISKTDYYFGEKGFFYLYSDENPAVREKENEIFDKHRKQTFEEDARTPFGLLELFPYASHNETYWIKGIKKDEEESKKINKEINKEIQKYIRLEKLLYSQQWIFCLLAFIMKKNPKLIVYFRKNSYDFVVLMREFVRIGDFGNEIKYLTKANPTTAKFSLANTRYFFSDLEEYSDNITFFEKVWNFS